jgi:hypothetical protein
LFCTILPRLSHTATAVIFGAGLTLLSCSLTLAVLRLRARRRRQYVRLRIVPYRGDDPSVETIVRMFDALHKRLLRRWWRRLFAGQSSVALEIHCHREAWLSLTCPLGEQSLVEAALRSAYPNCRLEDEPMTIGRPPYVLRVKKHSSFIKRARLLDHFEHDRAPAVNRLITTMAACRAPAFAQVALTPTPALFEGHSKRTYKRHEHHLSRQRKLRLPPLDRSMVEDEELKGGLDVQHRPLFFVDLRLVGPNRTVCERIASELRAESAENRLVERGTGVRHGWLGLYTRRVVRGEGNPLPSVRKGVFASTELASVWHVPSMDYSTVPFARSPLPLAPAPPTIFRPQQGMGMLRDACGPVSIHPSLRRQNTAVPGTVEQGKSSYLVATVVEDLRRERCAIIVLDPKGDAAEAAVSVVPKDRTCTLLDFSHPTCGFNPLEVDAPADTIADYVVGALKNLFSDGDIRASSDRYLRNAIIAVLAYDRRSTLWDAARLLSVGEEGYAYRSRVAGALRTQPEFKEISEFFTGELSAQLADARGTTTAKLDAPVNKLARLLNSPSIKRVLLNDTLRVNFDEVIEHAEVLVVKGALGAMGAGNTSVLMQLLVGMLDAALARRQDGLAAAQRGVVALKVDEAPLVLNRGFTETMALKRSAGLETVACWQTDSQWIDREMRSQLDALFAHRVYFATASVEDARDAASLMMAEFSDTVRSGVRNLSTLGRPDVRLHLPRHFAIASWVTPAGRQAPFVAQTLPLCVDEQRVAFHQSRQAERGGRYLEDLSQPHWERVGREHVLHGTSRDRPTAGPSAVMVAPPITRDAALISDETPTPAGSPTGPSPNPAPSPSMVAGDSTPSRPPVPALADGSPPQTASRTTESYSELADIRSAHSVRWAKRAAATIVLDPEPLDIEVLALLASLRHVLSSQIHRRFNQGRAATTTQRRLKRLSDAGLVARFQFHRRDGGGMPMCYSITQTGWKLLIARGHPTAGRLLQTGVSDGNDGPVIPSTKRGTDDQLLRQARHDVRVAGWTLAVEQALPERLLELRGPEQSVISPRKHSKSGDGPMLAPCDLCLPGGRTPHDFMRTLADGDRVEVERFQSIRPDATLLRKGGQELLVEFDERLPEGAGAAKLERYDHFLAGWSANLTRFERGGRELPIVVFVCRDRTRARECARRADTVLTASRAYAGEYPQDWEYPGRANILFAAERDAHEAVLRGWVVPALPPEVRIAATQGDPRTRDPLVESREIYRNAEN